MKVIPLSVPDLSEAEEKAVAGCVRSSWVSSAGPDISDFEADIAKLCQRKYGVATVSGTAALQLMLTGLGIGVGDRVIMPTYSFAATANAIIHAGAEPVFIDVTRLNWVIDTELVEQALREDPSIKAILAVDVLNNFPNFTKLQKLAKQYDVMLLEDAAGALATRLDHRMGGSFGTASIVSFNGNKVITTGGGGMILCDDAGLAETFRHLCAQARSSQDYEHDAVGFNFRMPNLNAALGRAQVGRLKGMLHRRQEILQAYQMAVSEMNGCQLQPLAPDIESNGWLTSLLFDSEAQAESFMDHMTSLKIMTRGFWKPLHLQSPYQGYSAYLDGVAEDIADRVVTLPSSSNLTKEDLDRILHGIREWGLD